VGLLFFAVVAPLICVAYSWLPLSVFLSSLCTITLHARAPYSQTVARAFARVVVSNAGPRHLRTSPSIDGNGQQQNLFAVRPTRLGCIVQPNQLLLEQMLSWAAILLSVEEWRKPLNVVTELPSICNAPGVRLLFQLSGFVDHRTQSVAKLLQRGHSLLCFDETLAALQAQKHSIDVQVVTIRY